jgi:enolase
MNNSTIRSVYGREILDSRGNPTVEVDVELHSGARGRMMVPSGASTGKFEALELRDHDPRRYQGKGVKRAVGHVNDEIAKELIGMDALDQTALDRRLIEADGTDNKARLGANAILGASLAAAHAAAAHCRQPLFRYLAERYAPNPSDIAVPMPMVNIISGGLHAGRRLDVQDFLVIPVGANDLPQALEMVSAVYWKTKEILQQRGYVAHLLADEGGFGPELHSNEEALEILCEALVRLDMAPGVDMALALDIAASHFYDAGTGEYVLGAESRKLRSQDMVDLLEAWVDKYPIFSIEDGLAEEDWDGWVELTSRLGGKIQLVGDDLFTTNVRRIDRGIALQAGNAVLIKMNQIGTLSETADAVRKSREAGFRTVISARSGETEDATLADLAVGLNGGQIKIGSLARSSRLSKYNQLLRIKEQVARFAGDNDFRTLRNTYGGRSQ